MEVEISGRSKFWEGQHFMEVKFWGGPNFWEVKNMGCKGYKKVRRVKKYLHANLYLILFQETGAGDRSRRQETGGRRQEQEARDRRQETGGKRQEAGGRSRIRQEKHLGWLTPGLVSFYEWFAVAAVARREAIARSRGSGGPALRQGVRRRQHITLGQGGDTVSEQRHITRCPEHNRDQSSSGRGHDVRLSEDGEKFLFVILLSWT